MRVLTVATLAALPRARALARSLARHQPGWPLDVIVLGREEVVDAAIQTETLLSIRSASRELELDTERLIARHSEEDLVRLLLPLALARGLQTGSEHVLHLPATAWVTGALEPIAAALDTRCVALFPRTENDVPDDGLEPAPPELERVGRVAQTVMAASSSEGGRRFLEWWADRVEDALGSFDGRVAGMRPEDRHWLARYLELAPARFGAAFLDDQGCNLSMWNLHLHDLSREGDALLLDGAQPLRFLDMPGFDPDRPHRLHPRATRVRVSRSPALRDLCVAYAAELKELGWSDIDRRADVGRRLSGGLVFDDTLRELYYRAISLGEDFGDLLSETGGQAFIAWLEGPAPEGSRFGVNRYVFYRVARERPDVVRAYPALDAEDGAEYVRWCWLFGREELDLPERFLPPRHERDQRVRSTRLGLGAATARSSTPAKGLGRLASSASLPVAPPPLDLLPSSDGDAQQDADGGDGLAVRVTGYLGNTLGLGAAARGYVQALRAAGVPVSTASVPLHHLELKVAVTEDYGRHGFEDLVHHGTHGFEIVAVNADELPDMVERLGEDYFEGPRIGVWGWETNTIPPRWRRAYALVDEVWVYSRFMAENIGAVAPMPVIALPPPVPVPSAAPAPQRLGVPAGFLFLFVFDYLSTIQRKNPVGLIDAFRRAFAPGDDAQLLIKTINAPLRPLADEEVLWAAHGREDIHVIDRSLNPAELLGLMAACDCYVSLHRAEGFGLTLAEAMALAKPVIATGYSGNVDFMTPENSYLVGYELGRVGSESDIYPPDGVWADPDVDHAARLMREVYEHPEQAAQVAARGREDVARLLSPETTGAAMRQRLEALSARAPSEP